MQQSDLEFNLCWVFDQLTRGDANSSGPSSAARKRATSHSSDHGGGASGSGADGPVLTLSHLRRVFAFIGVQLSDEELEEVMHMLDDDMDGKVTQQDFMHALKVHRSTPFDSRYAVNLAWSSLDSSTRDGVLSEEDSRVAREALGRMWGCDNEAEFNASVRAAHALQAQPERSVLSVHSDSTGSLPTSPAHNYTSGLGGGNGSGANVPSVRSRSNMYLDREGFRRIVSALAEQPAESVSPVMQVRTVAAPSFTQQMLHASAAASAAGHGPLDASLGLAFSPAPSAPVSPAMAYASLTPSAAAAPTGLPTRSESGGEAQSSSLAVSVGGSGSRPSLPELLVHSPAGSFGSVVAAATAATAAPLLPHAPHTARPSMSRKSSVVAPAASGSQTSTARGRRQMAASKFT